MRSNRRCVAAVVVADEKSNKKPRVFAGSIAGLAAGKHGERRWRVCPPTSVVVVVAFAPWFSYRHCGDALFVFLLLRWSAIDAPPVVELARRRCCRCASRSSHGLTHRRPYVRRTSSRLPHSHRELCLAVQVSTLTTPAATVRRHGRRVRMPLRASQCCAHCSPHSHTHAHTHIGAAVLTLAATTTRTT